MRRAQAAVVALAAASLLAAGACTTPAPSTAPRTASPPPASTGSPLPSTASAPASGASPSASTSAAAGIAVDPALLAILPASIEGVPLEFSAEASAEVAADPDLSGDVEAVAYAIAPSPATGDLLVVAVTRLRPGAFDDAFFRSWRDAYDAEVCAQAGGVRGNAEAPIGGRNVFIGSCVNGGHTYHVWLPGRRIAIAAFALGDRRLGERLMGELED